jgi:hypothetical protein
MSLLPNKNDALLNFLNARLQAWEDSAPLFAVSPAELAAFTASLTAAGGALDAANKARAGSKAATETQSAALRDLRKKSSKFIAAIRLAAERAPDPSVIYAAAQIPAPLPPAPRPAPDAPTDLTAAINASSGTITLKWKARRNASTVYRVSRTITLTSGDEVGPVEVGVVGSKSFTDEEYPAGTRRAVYTVIAQRGNARSPESITLTVNLSRGTGGTMAIRSVRTGDGSTGRAAA